MYSRCLPSCTRPICCTCALYVTRAFVRNCTQGVHWVVPVRVLYMYLYKCTHTLYAALLVNFTKLYLSFVVLVLCKARKSTFLFDRVNVRTVLVKGFLSRKKNRVWQWPCQHCRPVRLLKARLCCKLWVADGGMRGRAGPCMWRATFALSSVSLGGSYEEKSSAAGALRGNAVSVESALVQF
jgi:hypothetical protein